MDRSSASGSEAGGPIELGYALKKGFRVNSWRRRYFVFDAGVLRYYTSSDRKVQKGACELTSICAVPNRQDKKPNRIDFWGTEPKKGDFIMPVSLEAPEDREKWLRLLSQVARVEDITEHPRYCEFLHAGTSERQSLPNIGHRC